MKRKKMIYHSNLSREELVKNIAEASSIVKLVCGVGNNAAWFVCLDAIDHAKQCKRYYNYHVRHEFKQVIAMFHSYERNLIYATHNRMFHIDDMSEDVRQRFGDISDREYFEFWTGTGAYAYQQTKPLINSLWNKYRLSLINHAIDDAEHVAWVMTAQAALEIAVVLYRRSIDDIVRVYKVPPIIVNNVFKQFCMEPIAQKWKSALLALAPIANYDINKTEDRNIILGIEQLTDAWIKPDILYHSLEGAVADYDDVFAQGQQNEALREIAEIRTEIKNYE